MTYQVLKNGKIVRTFKDAERAIGYVADQTGKAPEFVAEETRKGRIVLNDQGDQAEWEIL